jgi:hypothetical protein
MGGGALEGTRSGVQLVHRDSWANVYLNLPHGLFPTNSLLRQILGALLGN